MSSRGGADDRDEMLRRVVGRAAGFHCWIVAVWYRNGRSVLGFGLRERDIARSVCGHSDIDRSILGKLVGNRFVIVILESLSSWTKSPH
jgi:hypothetical protein